MSKWKETWLEPSSKGDVNYTVGVSYEGNWACACIGWTRHMPRKDCRHIKAVKARVSWPTTLADVRQWARDKSNARRQWTIATKKATRDEGKPTKEQQPEPDLLARPMRVIELQDD